MSAGRVLPGLPACGYDTAQALKSFRNSLGSALSGAQTAVREASTTIATAARSMGAAMNSVDQILSSNPDPNTPNSLKSLSESLGSLYPTTDVETIERHVGRVFNLNVVNGILLPKGATKLGELRRMFKALELTVQACILPDLNRDFIMVTVYNETVETVTGQSCGRDLLSYTVIERKIGENISIARASRISGKPEDEILIRFFWIGEVKQDLATQKRLKALGLQDEDLTAVVMAPQETARVYSAIVDPTIITDLQGSGLTDQDICRLMDRDDTQGVNVSPTAKEVLQAMNLAVNQHTGSTRSRSDSIAPDSSGVAPAGRGTDPTAELTAVVDLPKSLRITTGPEGLELDGNVLDPSGLDERCRILFLCIQDSVAAIQTIAQQGMDLIVSILSLGSGGNLISAGMNLSTCLASIGLGLDASIQASLALPAQIQAFLAAFSAALVSVTTAILSIKALLCIPNALTQLLFGGICGFNPFEFDICPPDIKDLLDRLNDLVVLATGLISQLLGVLQIMKFDYQVLTRVALDLNFAATCAAALIPIAIALGLTGNLKIEASAEVEIPNVASAEASGTASISGASFTKGGAFQIG